MKHSILKIASELELPLTEIWEDLHRHPETGFEEIYTSKKVAEILKSLGIEVQEGVGKTGVLGIIKGRYPGKTILIRADMDALPITETTGLSCSSQTPGKMHACGHDAHTTWLLGTAMILSKLKEQMHGTIKFLFQPSEELPGGATSVIQAGVLENPKVDMAIAAHVSPNYNAGTYVIQSGPVTANPDFFTLKLIGKGAHGSEPQSAVDPINMGVKVYELLQTFVSRLCSPCQEAVLSVCTFHGGSASAAIPGECELKGTVRSFSHEVQQAAKRFIEDAAKSVTDLYGGSYELDYYISCFPTQNDEQLTARVKMITSDLLGNAAVISPKERFMGGEDFCFFAREVPSVYMFVGGKNDQQFHSVPLHNSSFRFDRSILARTAGVLAYNAMLLSSSD